jgi:hypothetical protein
MSMLGKTSIFLTGSLAGAMFAAAVMGSVADADQRVGRPGLNSNINAGLNPGLNHGSANCAPGFTVTNVWGSPVANPTPTTPSYGWTCITPVVHCVGAPGWLTAQTTQAGNGFGRVSYKCSWFRFG